MVKHNDSKETPMRYVLPAAPRRTIQLVSPRGAVRRITIVEEPDALGWVGFSASSGYSAIFYRARDGWSAVGFGR